MNITTSHIIAYNIAVNFLPIEFCRRISMASLTTKTVPHLADAIHAAVTQVV